MSKEANKKSPTLDEKLIKALGRVPLAVICGFIFGAIVEIIYRISKYGFSLDGLDLAYSFMGNYFRTIMLIGAIAGAQVGLIVSLVTTKIEKLILRTVIAVPAGIAARVLAEIIIRTIKEGSVEYALDFIKPMFPQILLAGLLVGLFAGLLPTVARKPEQALKESQPEAAT